MGRKDRFGIAIAAVLVAAAMMPTLKAAEETPMITVYEANVTDMVVTRLQEPVPHCATAQNRQGPRALAGARGNSAAEPGKFFVCGKAALRRQLIDEAWYKLRQLRGHFLFGQACLFRQSLNNGRTKRRSE